MYQRYYSINNKLIIRLLLCFLSPALALLGTLKERSLKLKKYILVTVVTFYGSTIFLSVQNDGYGHMMSVKENYTDMSFIDFSEKLIDILLFKPQNTTNDDVYIHVLSYFVGSVIQLPGLFFVFVSFIYAYFFAGSILKVFSYYPKNKKVTLIFYFLAITFVLWKNIDGINTVRTWTGLWVLFYGTISYYETKKSKYILLMMVPPFIHVGYFIMALPVWIVFIFGFRPFIYSIIFSLSFISSFFNQNLVISQLNSSQLGQSKVKSYYVEEQLSVAEKYELNQDKTWYRTLERAGIQYIGINIITFCLIFSGIYFYQMNYIERSLLSVGLLMKALSNSTWFLYALQNRSNLIAGAYILACLVIFLQRIRYIEKNTFRHKLIYYTLLVGYLFLLPFNVYSLAALMRFISIFMLFFPFVPWFFTDINISIREFVGEILF